MKYRLLGQTGLRVSEACLKTMTFGQEWGRGASGKEAQRIFDCCAEAGSNFIDNANSYTNGISETFINAMHRFFFAALLVISHFTQAQVPTGKAVVFAATKAANDSSLLGHIRQDAAMICRVYAENAIVLPPGHRPLLTQQDRLAYYKAGLRSGQTLRITTDTLAYNLLDENHAEEVGRYVIDYRAANSKQVTQIKGYYLIIWQRHPRRQWEIQWDMWQ